MNALEQLYLDFIRTYHKKAPKTEEYIAYMNERTKFYQELTEEQQIKFDKLMETKLDVEDNECLRVFKYAFMIGTIAAKYAQRKK